MIKGVKRKSEEKDDCSDIRSKTEEKAKEEHQEGKEGFGEMFERIGWETPEVAKVRDPEEESEETDEKIVVDFREAGIKSEAVRGEKDGEEESGKDNSVGETEARTTAEDEIGRKIEN